MASREILSYNAMHTAQIALTPPGNELSRVMYISRSAIPERFWQRKLFSCTNQLPSNPERHSGTKIAPNTTLMSKQKNNRMWLSCGTKISSYMLRKEGT